MWEDEGLGGARRRGQGRGMRDERIYRKEGGARGGRDNEPGKGRKGMRDEGMLCRRDEE